MKDNVLIVGLLTYPPAVKIVIVRSLSGKNWTIEMFLGV